MSVPSVLFSCLNMSIKGNNLLPVTNHPPHFADSNTVVVCGFLYTLCFYFCFRYVLLKWSCFVVKESCCLLVEFVWQRLLHYWSLCFMLLIPCLISAQTSSDVAAQTVLVKIRLMLFEFSASGVWVVFLDVPFPQPRISIESKHEVTILSGLNEFVVKFHGPPGSKSLSSLSQLFSSVI